MEVALRALWFMLSCLAPAVALATGDPLDRPLPPSELTGPTLELPALLAAASRYQAEGELGNALDVVDLAIQQRPASVEAQLLAASLRTQVLREHPDARCAWSAWPDVIQDHVRAALTVDPSVEGRLPEPLIEVLRSQLWWRIHQDGPRSVKRRAVPEVRLVAGLPVLVPEVRVRNRRVAGIVTGLVWYRQEPEPGADSWSLVLQPEGVAEFVAYTWDADGAATARTAQGSWRLQGSHLVLSGPHDTEALSLVADGLADGDGALRWTDRAPDCVDLPPPLASH